jgi:hypothetical protein
MDLFDLSETLGLKDCGKFDGTEWTVESLRLQPRRLLVLVLPVVAVAVAACLVLCFVDSTLGRRCSRGGRRAAVSISCLHS